MRTARSVLFAASLLAAGLANADSLDEATRAAYRLFDAVGMEQAMQESIEHTLEMQIRQHPTMAPFKRVMREFFEQYMSFDSVKHDLVPLYVDAFTIEELHALADFNETPLGQKAIRVMPQIMARSQEIGIARVNENSGVLQAMLEVEAARLQLLIEE